MEIGTSGLRLEIGTRCQAEWVSLKLRSSTVEPPSPSSPTGGGSLPWQGGVCVPSESWIRIVMVWRYGGMAVWRYGGLEVWWFGGTVVLMYGDGVAGIQGFRQSFGALGRERRTGGTPMMEG